MAGRDGTSGDNKGFKMVPMTDSKGKPVLDGKGKPVMTRKPLPKSEKEGTRAPKAQTTTATKSPTTPRSSFAPSTSKRPQARNNVAQVAQEGLDKAERGPSRRAGPRRQAVATQERPSGPKGPSPLAASETAGPRGDKPFAGTKPTRAEWDDMTVAERVRWGVVLPPSSKTSDSTSGAGTAGRRDRRAARRSATVGMAKGGMVKSNCGASMKPTQKGTKGK